MEGCFIDEKIRLTRLEVDRMLRSYKRLNALARSSRASGSRLNACADVDEAAIHAEMFKMRAQVLSVVDSAQRMLLYHHYIKGHTLIQCAKLLGISRRSVYRLKNRALDALLEIMRTQ